MTSEYHYFVERWSRRGLELVDSLAVDLPTGYADQLLPSPDGGRVALLWRDQAEWGWRIVDLGATMTVRTAQVFDRETNLFGAPAFSPDGAFLAAPATASFEWWLPPRPPEPQSIAGSEYGAYAARRQEHSRRGAVGGAVRAGWIWVQDLRTDETRRVDVDLVLPVGWGGSVDPDEDATPEVGPLRFVDGHIIDITMPDETSRTIRL